MHKTKSGFTIVELLIVIVVIGILAAIAIVAYNGVQQRARNAQQYSSAKAYISAFAAYVADTGAYPAVSDGNYCLGVSSAACSSAPAGTWVANTAIETALKTITSSIPGPNLAIPSIGSPRMGYIPYRGGTNTPTLDGVNSAFLIYTVEGTETCKVGPIASGPWASFSSAAPAQGYTFAESGLRVCFVPLPRA